MEHNERLGRMEERLLTVEEGVANYVKFQRDMRKFVDRFEMNEENKASTDKRRAKIHYTLLSLLIGLIIALFTFLLEHYDGHHANGLFPAPVSQTQPQDAALHNTR